MGLKWPEREADQTFHLVPKLRMSFTLTPFPPYAFMACTVMTLPFICIIRTQFLLDDREINNVKFALARKRQLSLSLPRRITEYHLPSIGHKVYNAASNDIYCTRLKAKCWPQDEELPNPATLCRNWTAAAGRYVSPCYTGNVSELRVLLLKVWFQRSFITCTSDDRNVFHASCWQELSKNVHCVSLTTSVSLCLYSLR